MASSFSTKEPTVECGSTSLEEKIKTIYTSEGPDPSGPNTREHKLNGKSSIKLLKDVTKNPRDKACIKTKSNKLVKVLLSTRTSNYTSFGRVNHHCHGVLLKVPL